MTSEHDDEQARIEHARRLRQTIEEIEGRRPARPSTPRDFTEQRAREAAAEERKRVEPAGKDKDKDKDDG